VLASLALVPAAIGVLAPAGPDEGCPSPRQVADALGAHLPGTVLPLGLTIGPSALRLAVATDPTGVTRVDLFESGGDTLLHRTLSPGERARGSDCPALAETAALIVERYWHEVGYDLPPLQPPPPPPPPPPSATEKPSIAESRPPPAPAPRAHPLWLLGLAAGGRAGDAGTFDPSALLSLTFEGSVGLRLSAGVMSGASAVTSLGTASFHQFPVRLGSYLRLPLGPGQLEPGLGVDLDAIWVGLTGMHPDVGLTSPPLCTGQFCASPGADLALGWSMTTTHHVYFRALALAGGAASLRFTADNRVLWSTPRTYVEFAIECGAWIE
jgi:hypothetical protein